MVANHCTRVMACGQKGRINRTARDELVRAVSWKMGRLSLAELWNPLELHASVFSLLYLLGVRVCVLLDTSCAARRGGGGREGFGESRTRGGEVENFVDRSQWGSKCYDGEIAHMSILSIFRLRSCPIPYHPGATKQKASADQRSTDCRGGAGKFATPPKGEGRLHSVQKLRFNHRFRESLLFYI